MIIPKKTRYSKAGLEKAEAYSIFCSTFLHHVGNDKYYGLPFDLEDFQRDLMWDPLFATRKRVNGEYVRKYRRALFGLPRNYGKTELAAALILTVANMEPIHNGQYGVIASSKEQAGNCFKKIKTMIRLDDTLRNLWEPFKDEIINKETGASIKVLPYGESQTQSWHFNVCVLDELHVYKDDTVWEAVLSGQKSIPNALTIGITTASDKQEGFLWELYNKKDDDTFLKVWIGLDEKDDPLDETTWEKLCLSSWVTMDDLRDQKKSMRLKSFIRYTLNAFPGSKTSEPAFDAKKAKQSITLSSFDWSRPLTLAIDGAVSGDCFAQVYGYYAGSDCHLFPIIFESGENTDSQGRYDVIDISESIMGTYELHELVRITGDPAYIQAVSQMLERNGIILETFSQREWAGMCNASQMLRNLIDDGRLFVHGPDAKLLIEHLKNCTVNTGNRDDGMWRIAKIGKTRVLKNDGAVASAMCVAVASTVDDSPICAEIAL